jgi:ankyrin repeat protein
MDGSRECCQRERYGYALYTRFKVPKLYKFAANGDWDLIPQRCKSNPKEAQFVHFYAPSYTALHRILHSASGSLEVDCATQNHIEQVKLDAISALLEANPSAGSVRDAFGRTPLHIACMDIAGCGVTAAYMIIDAYPKATAVLDVEGRTPVHYLIGRNDSVPLELLSKLISVFPDALKTQDSVMETPLQIAIQRIDELQNADAIIEMLNADGLIPSVPTEGPCEDFKYCSINKPNETKSRYQTV